MKITPSEKPIMKCLHYQLLSLSHRTSVGNSDESISVRNEKWLQLLKLEGVNMKKLEIKKLIEPNENILDKTSNWMYNWWGERDGYSFEEVKCFMEHSMQKDKLPQTYGLFLDGQIIGMYQFAYEDLSIRPDIYPWLANVYIDEKYRMVENYQKV